MADYHPLIARAVAGLDKNTGETVWATKGLGEPSGYCSANLVRAGALTKGQEILVIGKKTPAYTAVVEELQQNNSFVDSVAQGEHAGVKLPFKVNPRDKVFLWRRKP